MVLANGIIVTASSAENSDLYWALKGGGPNFGQQLLAFLLSTKGVLN